MFPLLTKYLVQYGHVCIPHIGTFEIIQEPPYLDVADKRFLPPLFKTRLVRKDTVPDHQFRYLAEFAGTMNMRKDLLQFGELLRESARRSPVKWNGFGTLKFHSNELVFEPESLSLSSLSEVPAHKVMRENVHHQVLVGDREMTVAHSGEVTKSRSSATPLLIKIAWILLGLAIAAIVVMLYLGKFDTSATGLRSLTSLHTP